MNEQLTCVKKLEIQEKGEDDEIYVKIAKILVRYNIARTRGELVGIADVSEQVHGGMVVDGMRKNEPRRNASGPIE